jgi:hypothetical protein
MSEETQVESTVEKGYIAEELAETKKALLNTQIYGSMFVFGIMCFLFSIANGFATNLEPKEAAKITKGLVVQRLDELQPQAADYLKQEIPALIKSVPDMAKSQLPVLREDLETTLESEIEKLANETSSQLDEALSAFLIEKQDEFKTIILAGQDKETTDEVAKSMREMFLAYLTEEHDQDESIQTKLDKALAALRDIEQRTDRMAHASDLDALEKKTRRAVACLFTTVRDNKDALNLPTQAEAQAAVAGVLGSAEDSTPR